MAYTFRGIAPGQRRSGIQTMQDIEQIIGRQMTADERARVAQRANYTDPSGAAEIDANAYNDLMQWSASQIPDGGGIYEPYGGTAGATATSYPTEGPLEPQPFVAPEWVNAPQYQRPEYQRYTGPTAEELAADPSYQFVRKQALGAVEGAAGAQGMSRTSRKYQGMATLAGDLASQQYENVYNRGLGEHRYGYEQNVAGADTNFGAAVANWEGLNARNQRGAELTFDRNWQRELYGRDDARTREFFNRDDAWRRYQFDTNMAESRRRFLANLGAGASSGTGR